MTEFGEATEIARAAGGEPPVLDLRGDEAEAVSIARKGALFYRARHGEAGEARARELEAFADAAFAWQHDGGSAPPPVLKSADRELVELERRIETVFGDAIAQAEADFETSSFISWLEELRDRIVGAEVVGPEQGAELEDEDLEDLSGSVDPARAVIDEDRVGPTARARKP